MGTFPDYEAVDDATDRIGVEETATGGSTDIPEKLTGRVPPALPGVMAEEGAVIPSDVATGGMPTAEPAIAEPKAASGFKFSAETDKLKADLVERLTNNGKELEQIYGEYSRRKNPIYRELLNDIKERGKVQMPPLEPLPAPPSFKGEMQAANAGVLSLGVLFGLFALTSRGRASTTTMLNAWAGTMEGAAKGNKEAATQEMERWKAAMDYTIKVNKQATDTYKQVIENQQMQIDEKLETLKVIAYQQGDEAGAKLLEQGNIKALAGLVEKNEKTQLQGRIAELQVRRLEEIVKAGDKKAAGGDVTMSERDLNELVDEYHATGKRPQLSVFGFRQAGDANRRAFQALLTERIQTENWGADWQRKAAADWTGEMAGARVGGTRAANLDILLRKAEAAIPLADAASRAVPRGSLVRLNALQLRGKEEISDPRVRIFAIQNLAVAEGWAAAMNPTGIMRESDRAMALENLKMSESQGTYAAALKAIDAYIKRERKAVQGFREHTPVEEETPAAATPPRTLGGATPKYQEGQRANGPKGPIVFRSGQWVLEATGQPISP